MASRPVDNRASYVANVIGQYVLLGLMIFVAVGAAVLIAMIVTASIPASLSQTASTSTGTLGAFDPSINFYSKYLLAGLILIAAALVEMFLLIMYGTFYVDKPDNVSLPLGLPPSTVRVFLVIVIVLVILVFALIPDVWGSNKAVVLLFGLLSTIIGFYFGSQNAQSADGAKTATVKLTLDDASKQIKLGGPILLSGKLDANFPSVFGDGTAQVVMILLGNDGTPLPASQRTGVADASGKVIFDYTGFSFPSPPSSCIVKVVVPSSVVCDERIGVVAS